jgi:hypothetical protein
MLIEFSWCAFNNLKDVLNLSQCLIKQHTIKTWECGGILWKPLHMSGIEQMPVAMQRRVDLISTVTHRRNNTKAERTVERNCDFCWVCLNISLKRGSKIWSCVLRDFDPRVTVLSRPRSSCTVNYRPILSSERVPHIKKPAIVRRKTKIWSRAPDGSPIPRQTGRLTVDRKLTLTARCKDQWLNQRSSLK